MKVVVFYNSYGVGYFTEGLAQFFYRDIEVNVTGGSTWFIPASSCYFSERTPVNELQ